MAERWWVIAGTELLAALRRVADGATPMKSPFHRARWAVTFGGER